MKAEVVTSKTHKQHTKKQNKIHHKSQPKEQEKKIVQIHRQRKDAHSTASLHMFPL